MAKKRRSARGGAYIDKSSMVVTSRGEYYLNTDEEMHFGEPMMLDGTAFIDDGVFNKRKVKTYPSDQAAGSGQVIGAAIKWIDAVDSWDADDFALNTAVHNIRDVEILLIGAIQSVNQGDTDVEVGDTVIPVDQGFEKMTSTDQYSFGKALQPIQSGEKGLIWVNPDYEKATT